MARLQPGRANDKEGEEAMRKYLEMMKTSKIEPIQWLNQPNSNPKLEHEEEEMVEKSINDSLYRIFDLFTKLE